MTHSARLILKKGVRHRILEGHPWVFASEVDRVDGAPEDGGTVEIRSPKGVFLGSALYNSRSQIVARRYSTELAPLDASLIGRRLDEALAHRRSRSSSAVPDALSRGAARRLVWSESDQLPGLIVDQYDDVLVLQTLTLAMSKRESTIIDLLRQKTTCRAILARNEAPVRQLEGLPLERTVLHGTYAAPTRVRIAGIAYDLDLWSGQKTGFYLDQAENYSAIAACAKGRRVLDCFTNQGAFALSALKAGAISCRGVDQSTEALRQAEATARAEGLKIEWMQANVFDLLRHYEQKRETFDLIILDPPSFTKTKGNKESALRGYHELHLRALRLLTPGGILATFSCSHHVTAEDWNDLLHKATAETGVTLRLRQRLGKVLIIPFSSTCPKRSIYADMSWKRSMTGRLRDDCKNRLGILALVICLVSSRTGQASNSTPAPSHPPDAVKASTSAPARKLKAVDADNRTVLINRPGVITLLLGTNEDSQDAARAAGNAMNPLRGRPDFQLIVVVDLRNSLASWVPSMVLARMRANLDQEAITLKPYFLKNGNKSNPRNSSCVIADFNGTICPQLDWTDNSDDLRGILFGADGREIERWDKIEDMDKLLANVRAAIEALLEANEAKAAAAVKTQGTKISQPPAPPLPLLPSIPPAKAN